MKNAENAEVERLVKEGKGRGSGRGARGGGGSTSSRNNTTNSTPVIGPTKATTILTAFQRQSSPYIRQLRGGLGRTIKKAIDSIISDNDIMNNNTFPEGPRNGITDSFPQKVNGAHGNIINGESDGYLHKKFKKVTSAELPDKKNGTISIQRYNHTDSTLTLTLSKSEEDEPKPDPPQNPLRLEASDLQNGNGSDTQTSIPTVYKPKFRLATANDPSTASVPEAGVTLAQHLEKIQEDRNQRLLHDIPLAIVSTSPVRLQAESLSIEGHVNPIYNGHTSRHQSLPLALTISPGTFSSSGTSNGNSNGNSNSNFNGNSNGNSSSGDKRFDRKSLDDHISKIINENQSILATWPEHLSKRSKGNGGRYSLGARSTTNSFGFGFDEPSRRDSLDFVMSSNTEAAGSSFFKLSNGSSQKSIYNISRSNSDVGQHFPFQDQTDSGERREDNNKQADSSFTVPKKRRRLSPAPGILSGGEVAEMPNNANGAIQGTIGTKQDQLAVPSVRNLCPQLQQQKEIDMTLRVSNCGNSGAKVTIRTSASGAEQLPGSRRSTLSHDESSNSSSTSSSRSHFSPDLRHNMIRIRKNSIFEMDTPAPSILPATSVPTTVAAPRKRGRPSKVHHEEAPKIRKVVERLQSHLNAKTAALAAQAQATVPPSSSSKSEFDKSALLQVITQKSIKTSVNYNNQETIKVPEAFSATTTNKPSPISTIPNSSSLLLQTTALNPKRPTFLALKPTNGIIAKKRLDLSACILPSPETPRGAKNYNQMHINGNAYTYLGFKISTKSSYTCLFKPQPMFVPQETDPKLSMYSNWQPRPKDANEDAKLKLSAYDSRVNLRRSGEPLFMTSVGNHFDTLTINSPENSAPKFSLLDVCDTMANSGNSRTRTPLPVYPNAANSTKGHVDEPLVVPSLTLRRSRSPSPLPPPPAESPKLIIDERPYEDRIPRTSTPKPEISEAEDDVLTPLRKLSLPHEVQSGQNLQSDRPSQGPQRFRKKSIYFPPSSVPFTHDVTTSLSSSESSSADELTNLHLSRNDQPHSAKGRSVSLCIVPTKSDMSLDLSNTLSMGEKQRSQSVSLSSPSAILSNLDSARVKIMEGGFESNEDYTYIRGRGRGRYVCESCGIRCKKPSMLRKHLKTHTDLRPYTCKLCNFSFKTKGNLTKHQKSKSHHKKCIGLGIHPDSSRSLEMTGPISDSNDEGDSDDDDDDDDDENDTDSFDDQEDDSRSTSDNCNDKEKFEKEIALSLLDLSQMSRLPEKRDRNISESSSTSLPPNRKLSSFSSPGALQSTPRKDSVDFEAPIDLSIKTRASSLDSQPKFFGGIVKSMEIVGEAQRWEPEEDFMQTGYLNLKKIRNHVEQPKVEDKSPVPRGSPEENIKIEVSPSAIVPPLPPVEDKPFEFEITKRRRVVSMCSSPTAASLPSTSRTSSHSLSISSPLQMCSTPPPSSQATDSRTPPPNSASLPKRLHQPWLSPQGIGEAQQQNSQEPEPLNSKTLNGREDSPVEVASEKEEKMDLQEEIQTRISLPLTIQASSSGGNGIKIPSTSNGASNFQGFGGLLLGLKPQAEFRQPSGAQLLDDGKADCNVCGKTFARAGQLTLHMNIHYLERPFRCDPCGVSFRTKGHLLKHRRSSSHDCKVYLTEAWGVANEENPRPFKCADCKIAFRIHGHLAKHLRSKMHIMRMECLGKLPFGIYFEMEKTGLNLNEIDTTDCDMSLVSLQSVAQKIYGDEWRQKLSAPIEEPA